MENVIYFSKIEYREVIGYGNTASVILLDILERELSYQVFDWKKQMPAIEGKWNENGCSYGITDPVKKIRNAKTGFEPRMVREEAYHREVVFSYAMKLNGPQILCYQLIADILERIRNFQHLIRCWILIMI